MAPLPPFSFSSQCNLFLPPHFPLFLQYRKSRPDPKLGNRPPHSSIPRGISVAWKFHLFFFCPHEEKMVFRLPVLPPDLGKCPCPMLSVQKSCRPPSTIHLSPSSPPSSKQRKENTIAPTLIFSQKKKRRKKKEKKKKK